MPDIPPPPEHPEVRYEKSDAWLGGVIAFGIMLVLLGLLVQASAAWLFDDLKASDARKYQASPSLAAQERRHLPSDLDKIPPPRLQSSEPLDLRKLRETEEALLHSYGWVDRKQGIVRIPIDEALNLLADPQTAASKGIRIRPPKENKK